MLGVEEARAGDLRGVVNRRPQEQTREARVAAEQGVGDERMDEEGEQPEERDRTDGVAGLVFVGADHGSRGCDRRVAADRRAHGDQDSEASRQAERASHPRGQEQRGQDARDDDRQRDQADARDRAQAEMDPEQRNADP